MDSFSWFQTPTLSPAMGDFIGTESCFDLTHDLQAVTRARGEGGSRRRETIKTFPPPIQSLGRSPCSVLKRWCASDGRLVITEELVGRLQFFTAERSDGRLTLFYKELFGEKDNITEQTVHHEEENDEDSGKVEEEVVGAVGGCGRKWNNVSDVRMSPCLVGMPVPAIRPVPF